MKHFPLCSDWTTYGPQTARAVIGSHYGVQCTEIEARAEILSLARKQDKHALDDRCGYLVASLEIAYGVRDLRDLARHAYREWKCGPNCNIPEPCTR